ncbi:MAG: P1 family peptidase [Firmicutes bacterium]|nr:P1 family peptidase [Bacillota bacterium]
MKGQKRIRDYNVNIGKLQPGENNSITDVKGVKVGHSTISNEFIKTGVTAILPHGGNIFKDKLIACSHVINGFGKTIGTIQIEELGTLETPIILTNTLSVGIASDALIEYMLLKNDDIGVKTGTVNPVVCECNDGYLNTIRGRYIKRENILNAIDSADKEFKEGSIGAGMGMSCYDLKGGIGTSSRKISIDNKEYTIGILVLSNFGNLKDFILDGSKVGVKLADKYKDLFKEEEDKGSIITILATDIPMSYRQLKRVSKRVGVGFSRTGSYIGNGSGEVVISFSTYNRIKHYEKQGIVDMKVFNENKIDLAFRAVAEATEEAVLNSLICSDTIKGRDGHIRYSLKEYINEL